VQSTQDYALANLGQLKAVAEVFYARLIELGVCSAYPWQTTGAEDYALATIGQAKFLFSFDLGSVNSTNDPNGNGITDWWENR
jgi:hypothetical protein